MDNFNLYDRSTNKEKSDRSELLSLFQNTPLPENELLTNLGLFIKRHEWSRYLFMNELYKKSMSVHGVVMEFGTRWGQNLALFSSLRGVYEPFNHNRRIIGFDSFEGFPSVHEKDGLNKIKGSYSVSRGYEEYLERLLAYHESESPIPHIKKFELIKGDVIETLDGYLTAHPETIIALAYFDMDIYAPTKHCLERIKPFITKGTVLGFDELNYPAYPGETVALREALGLQNIRIEHLSFAPSTSFVVIE